MAIAKIMRQSITKMEEMQGEMDIFYTSDTFEQGGDG